MNRQKYSKISFAFALRLDHIRQRIAEKDRFKAEVTPLSIVRRTPFLLLDPAMQRRGVAADSVPHRLSRRGVSTP